MGGFDAAFLRIPDKITPMDFAMNAAGLLEKSPHILCKDLWELQYADGYPWIHIPLNEGGCPTDDKAVTVGLPALQMLACESILLSCYTGVDSYYYLHRSPNNFLRLISVCEGEVLADRGNEESWEEAAIRDQIEEYKTWKECPPSWPLGFDVDMIIKAFHLPTPWDLDAVWDLEVGLD